MFEALTRREDPEQAFWPDYKAHVDRRNKIVHAGKEATTEEGVASAGAAKAFFDYVAGAWERSV